MHQPLEKDFYAIPDDELREYAELATILRDRVASRALELDRDHRDRHPDGPITEKRIDTLVQKRFHAQTQPKLEDLPKTREDNLGVGQLRARKSLCDLNP